MTPRVVLRVVVVVFAESIVRASFAATLTLGERVPRRLRPPVHHLGGFLGETFDDPTTRRSLVAADFAFTTAAAPPRVTIALEESPRDASYVGVRRVREELEEPRASFGRVRSTDARRERGGERVRSSLGGDEGGGDRVSNLGRRARTPGDGERLARHGEERVENVRRGGVAIGMRVAFALEVGSYVSRSRREPRVVALAEERGEDGGVFVAAEAVV